MNIYLESDSDQAIALHAEYIDGSWNGWPIPVVSAQSFQRFISEWHANDHNGMFNPSGVSVVGRFLVYDDGESDDIESWPAVDEDNDGNALYAIDGWMWVVS